MKLNSISKKLILSANIWIFSEALLGPLFAIFGQKIMGMNSTMYISYAWAGYMIMGGLAYIALSKLIERYNINPNVMCYLGYLLSAISTFGYVMISGIYGLILIESLIGISTAMIVPSWNHMFSRENNNSTEAWGLNGGLEKIGSGIAMIIGGLVVSHLSFNILFISMGLMQLVAFVVQLMIGK
jgi:predicted MFS family arabinose efflux permease